MAHTNVEETKSWVGVEKKETKVAKEGNTTTTTTNVTGDSASGATVTLRGNAGHETSTTTETKHGVLSNVTTVIHKEGILNVAGGASKKGLEVGASATAIEHGKTWTGKLTLGKLVINLPGIGLSWGVGAGLKVELGRGSDGRLGISINGKVGESGGIRYLPPTISWNPEGAK